jgi:5'-nucleotidase
VSNDDGVHAPGLAALADALGDLGTVYVVAPDREQSAASHALTLHRPLRVDRLGERRFAVDGTPSDAVNLAILGLLPAPPALVVAGINHGPNLGDDVTYSGTVSAAMEGTLLGAPSIAVSLADPAGGFIEAGRIARLVAARVLVEGLPPRTLLNVNVPGGVPRGIRLTQLGHRVYKEKVVEQVDPRGRSYYWIGGGPAEWDRRDATDMAAVHDGYASVTPLHLDLTHLGALARMADWPRALSAQYNARSRGRKR